MPADDPFALLGLARSYAIDAKAVNVAYLRRAAALHPDRIADPIARAEAEAQAAALNEAKAILLDDEARAEVLLALLGGPAPSADRTLPDGFLVEMLERREALEAAQASGDAAALAAFDAWADAARRDAAAEVAALFAQHAETRDPELLVAVRRCLNRWRYVERMREALADA